MAISSQGDPDARDITMRCWLVSVLAATATARTAAPPLAAETARLRGGAVLAPKDSYAAYAKKGAATSEMSPIKALHSSVHTGCIVAFGGLLALNIAGAIPGLDVVMRRIVFGLVFPYAMYVILQSGGQLYTGNAGAVTAAYLEGLIPLSGLLRALAISLVGNFFGCAFFAWLSKALGLIPPFVGELAAAIAEKKLSLSFGLAFYKGIVCNWLVCLGVFLAGQADDAVGKIFAFYFPLMAFIICGLEHSVANAFLLPLGMYGGAQTTFAQIATKNLVPVVLGNAIGGGLLVAASYSFQYGKLGEGF